MDANEYGPAPYLHPYEEDDIITWVIRRQDGMERYVGTHGPEGMLSPAQGLVEGKFPFPEHVGLSTVVDY